MLQEFLRRIDDPFAVGGLDLSGVGQTVCRAFLPSLRQVIRQFKKERPAFVQGEGDIRLVLGNAGSGPDAPLICLQGKHADYTVLRQPEPDRAVCRRRKTASVREDFFRRRLPGHICRQGPGVLSYGLVIVRQEFFRGFHSHGIVRSFNLHGVGQHSGNFLFLAVLNPFRQQKDEFLCRLVLDAGPDIEGVFGFTGERFRGSAFQLCHITFVCGQNGIPVRRAHRGQNREIEQVRKGFQLRPADASGGKGIVALHAGQDVHSHKAVPQIGNQQRPVLRPQTQRHRYAAGSLEAPFLEAGQIPHVQHHVVEGPPRRPSELVVDFPIARQLRLAVKLKGAVLVDIAAPGRVVPRHKVPYSQWPDLGQDHFHPAMQAEVIFSDDFL